MAKIKASLILIVTSFMFFANVNAQEIIDNIVNKGELRVGMTGTQPPYSIESVDGDLIGYEVDLAKIIAESIGVELKIVRMPFNELLPSLEANKIDIVMSGMTMTTPRNTNVMFLGPYIYSGKSILTLAQIFILAETTAELNKKSIKITTMSGSTSEKFVLKNMPKAKLLAESNYDESFKLLMDGKADIMLADFSLCRYTVLRSPDLGLETFDDPFTKEPIGLAIKHTDPLFFNLLENLLTQLDADGTLEGMNDKWFWDDEWIDDVK
jgi:polar amino acid transport system substrate-binding protein